MKIQNRRKTVKAVAVALALTLLCLALAGCKKETTYANALERVLGTGQLVMATNPEWAPFEFENLQAESEADRYVGCDIELGRYIAEQLGVELVLTPMAFEAVIESVVQGQADVGISGLAWTEDRAANTLMAGPYAMEVQTDYQGVLIRKGTEGELASIEALNGRPIAVQIASLQMDYAAKYLPDSEITTISSPIDGVLALQNGDVDGFLTTSSMGVGFMANYDDVVMSEIQFPIIAGCWVILKPGEQELCDRVQEIVTEAEESGKFAQWRAEAEALATELGLE